MILFTYTMNMVCDKFTPYAWLPSICRRCNFAKEVHETKIAAAKGNQDND